MFNFKVQKITVVLLLVSIFLTACTDTDEGFEIFSYGLVESKPISKEENNTILGSSYIIDSWNIVETTTQVPRKIGIEFGVAYRFNAPNHKADMDVEEVIIFPGKGLTNPKTGKTAKADTSAHKLEANSEQFFSYKLEEPWEAKSGTWIFQVKQDGQVVLEKIFHVE